MSEMTTQPFISWGSNVEPQSKMKFREFVWLEVGGKRPEDYGRWGGQQPLIDRFK